MSSKFTANYGLCQWEAEDKVLRTEFNEDNARIDRALAGMASAAALSSLSGRVNGLSSSLSGKGNCKIQVFSYTGNGAVGKDNPTVISFPKRPALFLIFGGSSVMIGRGGESLVSLIASLVITSGSSVGPSNVTWSGNSVSFYAAERPHYQMNSNNTLYTVVSFYAEDGTA